MWSVWEDVRCRSPLLFLGRAIRSDRHGRPTLLSWWPNLAWERHAGLRVGVSRAVMGTPQLPLRRRGPNKVPPASGLVDCLRWIKALLRQSRARAIRGLAVKYFRPSGGTSQNAPLRRVAALPCTAYRRGRLGLPALGLGGRQTCARSRRGPASFLKSHCCIGQQLAARLGQRRQSAGQMPHWRRCLFTRERSPAPFKLSLNFPTYM